MHFIYIHKATTRSQFWIKNSQHPFKNYAQNKFYVLNALWVYSSTMSMQFNITFFCIYANTDKYFAMLICELQNKKHN